MVLLAELRQELQVDHPWHGIRQGEAVVGGGTEVGHVLLEQVLGSTSDPREGLAWPERQG